MFRLAGENDAESIFEIQGTVQFPKGIAGYSNTQGARGAAVWFQYTFSKFSECV
jgi:hypothetical protein